MPMMKNVLGLDIGSHSVKAVEFRQTFRALEPVQLRVHPRADAGAPIDELLRRFQRMHNLPTEHITCAIPGDQLSTRRLEFPFRDRKKLAAAVPFEVEGEIPFHLEDVVIDWEIVGGEARQATVAATIVQRRHLASLLEDLGKAGCEPRILEAEGLVLGNLATLFDLPGKRVLIDIGHRKTTFCLLVDEHPVAARTLPIGGLALSEAIAKDRGWTLDEAERAKCEDGVFHLGFNGAAPGAVAVLDRIARETMRFLESLEEVVGGAAETQIAALTLMGGSARLLRIDEYLSERTGIPATRLSLPPEAEGAALVAGGDPVLFAPAVALALRGTAQAQTRVNFRQDEFAYRKDLRQYFTRDMRPTAVLAGVAALLGCTWIASSVVLDSRRASQLEGRAEQLYSEAFPNQPVPENPVSAMSQAGRKARDLADFLGVYGGNLSALDLLGEISRRVPGDLDVQFEQVSIDPNLIRIKAFSSSIADVERLKTELAKFEVFKEVEISGEIGHDRKRDVKKFDLNIQLDPT